MPQSLIGWVVGCPAVAVVAFALARRHRNEHPDERMLQWFDSHDMGVDASQALISPHRC